MNALTETWLSHSVEETLDYARRFASRLQAGTGVALQGDLGAGKTCFAKGVISQLTGLDPEEITSPTFTLVEEYDAAVRLYHVDLYRMNYALEAEELPWDEILAANSIALVEWPERAEKVNVYCQFHLLFSKEGPNERRIVCAQGRLP